MRISQYSYFALRSYEMTPDEMTARVGCPPDRDMVRGSMRLLPKEVPVWHGWEIACDAPGLRVDDQLDRILDRLEPFVPAIVELLDDCRARGVHLRASVHVVRKFKATDGADEEPDEFETPTGTAVKAAGQHQLLGWHLDRRLLDFLRVMGAELDVDEYG